MGEDLTFPVRLAAEDWEPSLRAWRCPALDIRSAYIVDAYTAQGQPISPKSFEVEKGPARVSWKAPEEISQITVMVGLREKLSPVSEERFWKHFAIVVPIITALIGAWATWLATGDGKHPPGPTPAYTLRLRVDPNDVDASGLPPAKITVNDHQLIQPIDYKIDSDVIAIVDVSKAFNFAQQAYGAYSLQNDTIQKTLRSVASVIQQVIALQKNFNGNICSGGSNGIPPQDHVTFSNQTGAAIADLQQINTDLVAASRLSVTVPK